MAAAAAPAAMGFTVHVPPSRTFSSTATTLGGVAPSASPVATYKSSHSNSLHEVHDVYGAALAQLSRKIPDIVSQAEYEAVLASGDPLSSTTDTHARDLLESIRSDAKYHTKFHQFFDAVHALFEPLRLFKSALDTLCQVEPVGCLVWGSVKILIEIAREVSQVPAIVNQGIEHLVGYFPAYQEYHKCLLIPTGEGLPLRTPLVNIYVEYLTFCILARRLATRTLVTTVRAITVDESAFHQCLASIRIEAVRVREITAASTLRGVWGANERLEIIMQHIASGSTLGSIANSSATFAKPCHMVPGRLCEAFVGRKLEMEWLRDQLQPEEDERKAVKVGIYGMTGIGKTQLLLKYEAVYRKFYHTQLFLSAPSRGQLLDSIQEVLVVLGLPQQEKADPTVKVLALHNWLLQSSEWLLLIDNVAHESVDLIRQLLASSAPGHVIVTSQARGAIERVTGSPNLCLQLQQPAVQEAVGIFVNAAGIALEKECEEVGIDIVTALGFLPHAIEQAASYTRYNDLTPRDFLSRYQKTPDQILDWEEGNHTQRHAISRHFKLIFDSLEPDELAVLTFFSLLEPESMPLLGDWHRTDWTPGFAHRTSPAAAPRQAKTSRWGWLRDLASCFRPAPDVLLGESDGSLSEKGVVPGRHLSQRLADTFADQVQSERVITKLCDLSLMKRFRDDRLVWMHDLTRKSTRATIPPHDRKTWVGAAVNVMYHAMPVEDTTATERAWVDICLPSAMGLLRQAEALGFETSDYACFLALSAFCNLRHGAWGLSETQFKAAQPEYERYLGSNHGRTLTLIHQYAWAVRNDGDARTAEAMFRSTWERRIQTSGPNAPETLAVLDDLASTIERAGRLKEAEAMFKKLYEGHQDSVGPQSQETLAAGHNYAVCFHNQGRLREASEMYRAILETTSKELGLPHDEGTLKTLSNYAATLDHDGRCNEARAVYEQALSGYKAVLGFDHVMTLRLRGNMASLLKQQGQFDEAEIMLGKSLERAILLWGAEGIETMAYLYDMGEVWQARGGKGGLQKARDVFKKLADGLSGDMAGHPLRPRWIDSWASAEREMGHLPLALEKSKEAYDLFEKLLGWHDPYTLVAANDYAETLQAVGRYTEAWDLYDRCCRSFETLVGKDHPHYAMSVNDMGRCCWAIGGKRPVDAESFFIQAREVLKARLGDAHFCTLTVSLNLARTKSAAGDAQGAIALAEETRDALKAAVGQHHPLVSAAHLILGIILASGNSGGSLLAAAGHIRSAVATARDAEYTAGSNYFLSIALLALLLRRAKSNELAVTPLLEELRGSDTDGLSAFDIPGVGRLTALQLAEFDPPDSFNFGAYIPLSVGETVKLRWGRKTCWREASKTTLHC